VNDGKTDRFGLVGTTIAGKYRVERVLGEGGFGIVYAGVHLVLAQPIAIKCLKPGEHPGATDFTFASFQREARLLFGLTHPAVVRLYDIGEVQVSRDGGPAKTAPYVVLERIEGTTLQEELKARRTGQKPPYSAAELLSLFDDVLSGLACAHEAGIVHRDIKPSNIMVLARDGKRAKVLDFGMAVASDLTSGAPAGLTPRYAAPEQWVASFGAVDAATDIFSAGLVLDEMCTLQMTIRGDTMAEMRASALDTTRETVLARVRPDLAALAPVVARATRVTPSQRYPSATVFLEALRAALDPRAPRVRLDATAAMAQETVAATVVAGLPGTAVLPPVARVSVNGPAPASGPRDLGPGMGPYGAPPQLASAQPVGAPSASGSQRDPEGARWLASMSTQSLVLSLVGGFLCCVPSGLAAIVQALRSRALAKRLGVPFPDRALVGLWLGVLGSLSSSLATYKVVTMPSSTPKPVVEAHADADVEPAPSGSAGSAGGAVQTVVPVVAPSASAADAGRRKGFLGLGERDAGQLDAGRKTAPFDFKLRE